MYHTLLFSSLLFPAVFLPYLMIRCNISIELYDLTWYSLITFHNISDGWCKCLMVILCSRVYRYSIDLSELRMDMFLLYFDAGSAIKHVKRMDMFLLYFDAGSGCKHVKLRISVYFDAGSGWEENRSRICMYFDAGSAGDQNKSRKHRMNFSGS